MNDLNLIEGGNEISVGVRVRSSSPSPSEAAARDPPGSESAAGGIDVRQRKCARGGGGLVWDAPLRFKSNKTELDRRKSIVFMNSPSKEKKRVYALIRVRPHLSI